MTFLDLKESYRESQLTRTTLNIDHTLFYATALEDLNLTNSLAGERTR